MAFGWRGEVHHPEISGTTKGMTMKFLSDVGIHKEAGKQKNCLTYLAWSLNHTLRREGEGPGSKNTFGLYPSPRSLYFLRNHEIFVYYEKIKSQSLGLLFSPIQNIGGYKF